MVRNLAALMLVAASVSLPAQEILQNYVSAPVSIRKVEPEYTKEAFEAKLEGSVRMQAVVGIDGTLSEIEIVRWLGGGLDEKAVECARKWRFKPGMKYGEPTPVKVTIEINYRLPRVAPVSK